MNKRPGHKKNAHDIRGYCFAADNRVDEKGYAFRQDAGEKKKNKKLDKKKGNKIHGIYK